MPSAQENSRRLKEFWTATAFSSFLKYDWMTGVPDNRSERRKLCVVPRLHLLRPLVLCFDFVGRKQKGF